MLMLAHAQKLHIAYDGKLYAGILHACRHAADGYSAISLLRQLFERFLNVGDDARILQKALQKLGSAHVSCQNHNAEALLEIRRNVLGRGLDRACVRRQLLCRDARERFRLHGVAPDGECVGHVQRVLGQDIRQLIPAYAERRCVGRDHAAFDKLAQIVAELLCKALCPVRASGRLVEENHRLLGYVVRARGLFVQKRHVSVGVFDLNILLEPLDIRAQVLLKLPQLLRAFVPCAFIRDGAQCVRKRLRSAGSERHKALCRREYSTKFDAFRSALGLYVEKAHAVDIVAPEFNAHRLGIRRREKVDYSAAPGKLACALDLLAAGVAAAQKRRLQLLGRAWLAVFDRESGFAERLRRYCALHERRYRCYRNRAFAASEGV